MIQIDVLNGSKAGSRWVVRRFPFRVGRGKQAALALADDGIWESHLEITVQPGDGCLLSSHADALTLLNGRRVTGTDRLRSGDLIEAGSVKLRFSFSPVRLASGAWREVLVWAGIVLLCLGQIALIYFVLP